MSTTLNIVFTALLVIVPQISLAASLGTNSTKFSLGTNSTKLLQQQDQIITDHLGAMLADIRIIDHSPGMLKKYKTKGSCDADLLHKMFEPDWLEKNVGTHLGVGGKCKFSLGKLPGNIGVFEGGIFMGITLCPPQMVVGIKSKVITQNWKVRPGVGIRFKNIAEIGCELTGGENDSKLSFTCGVKVLKRTLLSKTIDTGKTCADLGMDDGVNSISFDGSADDLTYYEVETTTSMDESDYDAESDETYYGDEYDPAVNDDEESDTYYYDDNQDDSQSDEYEDSNYYDDIQEEGSQIDEYEDSIYNEDVEDDSHSDDYYDDVDDYYDDVQDDSFSDDESSEDSSYDYYETSSK